MPKHGKFILGVIGMLAFVVSLGAVVYAWTYGGLSPFVVIRGGRTHEPKIYNPTKFDLFAVAIYYDSDETFDFCESFNLSPHDTDFGSTFSSSRGHVEIIAGISGLSAAGINPNVGIVASTGKGRVGQPLNPEIFSVTDSDAITCICDELDSNGESATFFKNFRVKCS